MSLRVFLFLMMSFSLWCGNLVAATDETHHILTSDSVSLYVHVKGEGPMCLYLHGGPGSGSTWMEDVAGSVLEKRFTMVYLDQRGVCKSSTPQNDDFSFNRQIEDWEEVRKALGVEHWLLMGHSWGGVLEMGYWQKHPDRIDGMIFLNATISCKTSFIESWLPKAISIVGDKVNPIATDTTRTIKERMMAIFPQLNNDNRWQIFTPNRWANDSIGSWRYHTDCISHEKGETPLWIDEYWQDFRKLTPKVYVPVLYLYGKYDYAVGPDFYKGLHFPNAIIQGADCGHIIFLEEPKLFEESLDKFLVRLNSPRAEILKHIEELRALVNDRIWPGFNSVEYDVELQYFDEGNFRMQMCLDGENPTPKIQCSSPEITFKTLHGVKRIEEWYAMLLHEYFHVYQYKHPYFWHQFMDSSPKNCYVADTLTALKHNHKWYSKLLAKENKWLQMAYDTPDKQKTYKYLSKFLSVRDKRLEELNKRLGLDLREFYPLNETDEGTARYIEYRLYQEQGLPKADWMIDLNSDAYYYSSGLMLILIMDKLGIDYKSSLFVTTSSITELLRAELSKLKKS